MQYKYKYICIHIHTHTYTYIGNGNPFWYSTLVFLRQGIFPTQGLNLYLLHWHLLHQQVESYHCTTWKAIYTHIYENGYIYHLSY